MNPEVLVYRTLNSSKELADLMNKQRGNTLPETAIFTYDVPENYQKSGMTPFIKITYIDEFGSLYADNAEIGTTYRIQLSYWNRNAQQNYELTQLIDKLMNYINFERYDNDRYTDPDLTSDPDISVLLCVRKYIYTGLNPL